MNGAAEILVIVLAILLAIFLVLAIALAVLLIKISKQIKSITGSAERTVNSVESAALRMGRLTSPALLMKLVTSAVKKGTAAKSKKSKEEHNVKRK